MTSAVRGGAYVGLASAVGIGLNYLFLVASGRLLGSDDYGELAAILGLLAVVMLPLAGVQMAVSREVARSVAEGSAADGDGFSRTVVAFALRWTVPLVAAAVLLAFPVSLALNIPTTALVVASLSISAALVAPVGMGVIQGEQRFSTLALVTVVPFGVRLVVLAAVAVVGATLVGTVTAIAVAGVAASAVSFIPVRRLFRHPSVSITPSISLRAFSRYLLPVLVGLLAITLIVNIDVIVVNARFADADAGVYAAAAAFGRVGYFLPGTILTVLFPRTAARQARGEQTDDILGRSLIVTAGFCVLLAAFYWTVGGPLVRVSFGQDFANAADLLPLFALEMMFVSAANVLVGFHLSRNESRFAWIAAATVPVQIVLLATVPDTLRGVVWTNIIVGVGLLGVHELAIGSSLPALRAGMRRFRRQPDGLD